MQLSNIFTIYPKHIINNILEFKKYTDAKICAIVKADAYGHGIEGVVQSVKGYVDFFGVADECEALKVREITNKPILILNMALKQNLEMLIKNQISLSVSSLKYLKTIINVAKKLKIKAKVHIKINTGMNRLGFSNIGSFKKALKCLKNEEFVVFEGIYTHFFDSTNKTVTEVQYNEFCKYVDEAKTNFNPIIHASASNAVLMDKKYQFDMVRLGISMYGYSELDVAKFTPALSLTSKITNIIKVKKGQTVGYGGNYTAQSNIKVACVALGYADGLLRANSNNGKVIVNKKYAQIVGNICMDLFMIDVTNINCRVGDTVVIIGKQGDLEITAQDIAKNTNTICYEVLTNLKRDRMNYRVNLK